MRFQQEPKPGLEIHRFILRSQDGRLSLLGGLTLTRTGARAHTQTYNIPAAGLDEKGPTVKTLKTEP